MRRSATSGPGCSTTSAEGPATLAAALRAVSAEVEDAHGVHVEVVCVGDAPVSEEDRPLVLATREAITNAAKHSGVSTVDVYAEATPSGVEVFVRDRGTGFDAERSPTTGKGSEAASSGAWSATAARPPCAVSPARAPRSGCSLPTDPETTDHQRTPTMHAAASCMVDDHAMFRTGVRAELGSAVQVVAEAADVEQAVTAVIEHQPEVVLLDVHLPGGGGAEVCGVRRARRATLASSRRRFLRPDLLVGVAARDQPHHLALALGEPVEVLVDGGDLDGAGEGVQHEAGQPG